MMFVSAKGPDERQRPDERQSAMSAKGAEYESQGQAPNNVRRVAPGKIEQ
jgi:hypothetical protein